MNADLPDITFKLHAILVAACNLGPGKLRKGCKVMLYIPSTT
jgi:hypothetical protein